MLFDYSYVLYIRLSLTRLLPVFVCYAQSSPVLDDVSIRKVVNDMDWLSSGLPIALCESLCVTLSRLVYIGVIIYVL